MKNILVIGSTGQIGSELTRELRKRYGAEHVVAGYIPGAEPTGELRDGGPSAIADVTNGQQIAEVVRQYDIDSSLPGCERLSKRSIDRKPSMSASSGRRRSAAPR